MIEIARRYIGTPFRHAGRCPKTGIDCAGLISLVLTDLGVPFEDQRAYGLGQDNVAQYEHCLESAFERCERREATVLLFRYTDERGRLIPCHSAIASPGAMVHVPFGGVCVEEPLTGLWLSRVRSAWRLR